MLKLRPYRIFSVTTLILVLLSVHISSAHLQADHCSALINETAGFSQHSELSHIHIFDDDCLVADSKPVQSRPACLNTAVIPLNFLLPDSFCHLIWQPPKVS
jgi:hypothetical protein